MFETVDYRATRALQICIVFVSTLAIQRWLQFTHAGWIGFAVMMIYAGFDPGTSLHRTMHRFWGAILGLLLSYVLFLIIRIDCYLISVVIPIVVFFAFFSMGNYYVFPTIFTVTLTALGLDYYASNTYAVDIFLFDYFRSTLIALSICVFFEYFVFKKNKLTRLFYVDLQTALLHQLQALLHVVSTQPIRRSRYLKLSAQLNVKALELNLFLYTMKHDYHLENQVFTELDAFNKKVEHAYQNIRQLFIAGPSQMEHLILETDKILGELVAMHQHA